MPSSRSTWSSSLKVRLVSNLRSDNTGSNRTCDLYTSNAHEGTIAVILGRRTRRAEEEIPGGGGIRARVRADC